MSVRASRVLVCGGRAYRDIEAVNKMLTAFHHALPIALLITGGAPGADSLAEAWAEDHDIPCTVENARWETEGRAAGPLRNQRMIDLYDPTHLIAFPGGRGTADMMRRAEAAGLPVLTVNHERAE